MAISLAKGQKISLEKSSDAGLSRVIMGLGWDAKKVKSGGLFGMFAKETTQSIDLDASCVMFDAAGAQTDTVWFRQLASKCGSVSHTGDNRTGDGDGDDEQIIVELGRVPANVKHLVFVVNSFTGQSFDQIDNATCRLVDARGDKELLRYELSGSGSHNAQVMLRLYREGGGWQVHAIGEKASGRTFEALLPAIRPHLN
jgi:tellurium resistance protein TerZ